MSVDELGYSVEEWKVLTEEQRESAAKELAFSDAVWGYREIDR